MKKLFAVASVLAAFSLSAQAEYKYDWKTGNSYNTYKSGDTTYVQGYNTNTGSSWNSKIDSSGNQSGTDSEGNYWQYNSGSKVYTNSNGTICTGSGYSRVCN